MPSHAFLLYLLVGPFTWVLLFIGTRMGRVRMGKLMNWKPQPISDPPRVSILIPAKDEATHIRRCIDSVFAQEYANFEIIAINDRSTDDTGNILDSYSQSKQNYSAIHIADLPPGWLGKSHALSVGASRATAEWLLFVDSDVTLETSALTMAISIALQREYDAVSLLTRLECDGFLDRWLLPPLAGAWAVMHKISVTNEDTRKKIAAANGQFFLIRKSAYDAVGGHAAVKNEIVEDVELMRNLKAADFIVRFFIGAHLASTRMHASWQQMFRGWARIYSGTARRKPYRLFAAMFFVVASILSVYPALYYGVVQASAEHRLNWLIAASIHFALLTIYFALIYKWSGNRAAPAFLAPITGFTMLAIFTNAIHKCFTGKHIWRDTRVELK